MSPNTVASYCHDVEAFLNSNGAATSSVTASDIESYLGSIKVSKRSSARILSALRSFFDWCVQEGQTKDNPAALVDSPKLGKYLPAVLSVDEVSAIMDSVDLKAPAGKRDRHLNRRYEIRPCRRIGCLVRISGEGTDDDRNHRYQGQDDQYLYDPFDSGECRS